MIVLASASPRRKEILTQMGLEFIVRTSDAPEFTGETDPGEMVKALSRMKAEAVFRELQAEQIPAQGEELLVIAADTLVFADGKVLGKPRNRREAYDMLFLLQGRSHEVRTGVTLIYITQANSTRIYSSEVPGVLPGEWSSFQEVTRVSFAPMSDFEINALIDTGEPMDKAGAYGIQGRSAKFITGIEGDYYNVMGLPMAALYSKLKEIGFMEGGLHNV